MVERQKTIQKEFVLSGKGLHTGCQVHVTFKPAPENTGIQFIRVDLPQRPVFPARLTHVCVDGGLPRCTSLGMDGVVIHTVEHLMSVLWGLGIDNLSVEINAQELPGLDGSGLDFLKAFQKAGVVEQEAQRAVFEIQEPISVQAGDAAIFVVPAPEFKISYVLDYNLPLLHGQVFHQSVNKEIFETQIAPARTFCLESEANQLRNSGLGQGASYANTLVFGEHGVIRNELRFPDECARHKVLDFIGDLNLLGMPFRGQVFALKSGHYLNLEMLKKIVRQKEQYERKAVIRDFDFGDKKIYEIQDIVKILPHRYPFLFVDRVVELEKGRKAVGIKNITMNDYFFQGHFPARPVMPGVIMVEAMAQTGGVVVLTNEAHRGKLAFFLSTDNVKFRKVVVPGDQLRMEVEVVRDKPRAAQVHAVGKVDDEIVVEADMIFSFTDESYLNPQAGA